MALLDTFPVSMKVAGRRIVIVGGGIEALNKTRLALKTSAEIDVWARGFDAGFDALGSGRLTLNRREEGLQHLYGSGWLDNAALVFIADDGPDGAFAEAQARGQGIAVNVVDRPARCDFYTPAIVDRAPLSIAIASEGAAPVIARRIRARIEALVSPQIGQVAALAGSLRGEVEARLPAGPARRHYYEQLADSAEIAARLTEGPEAARQAALVLLDAQAGCAQTGTIAWVGAGPGAEDLLTLRAQRLLQAADIIVHDDAIPSALIEMGRRDAERLPVDANSPLDAAETGAKLVALAGAGRRIVWLVAGDVDASGATGIEIAAARKAGVFVSVVPGIAGAAMSADAHMMSEVA